MKLLVDDFRDRKDVDLIARSYDAALFATDEIRFDVMYLDHDLASDKTGYHLVCHMIEKDLEMREYIDDIHYLGCTTMPKEIVIVSSNPVGVQNIERALANYGYTVAYKGGNKVWVRDCVHSI